MPFMLDRTKFEMVLAGLKWCQGKSIVNIISPNVDEKLFKEQAADEEKHGATNVYCGLRHAGP